MMMMMIGEGGGGGGVGISRVKFFLVRNLSEIQTFRLTFEADPRLWGNF